MSPSLLSSLACGLGLNVVDLTFSDLSLPVVPVYEVHGLVVSYVSCDRYIMKGTSGLLLNVFGNHSAFFVQYWYLFEVQVNHVVSATVLPLLIFHYRFLVSPL